MLGPTLRPPPRFSIRLSLKIRQSINHRNQLPTAIARQIKIAAILNAVLRQQHDVILPSMDSHGSPLISIVGNTINPITLRSPALRLRRARDVAAQRVRLPSGHFEQLRHRLPARLESRDQGGPFAGPCRPDWRRTPRHLSFY
jgi:hypothetical protein